MADDCAKDYTALRYPWTVRTKDSIARSASYLVRTFGQSDDIIVLLVGYNCYVG